MAFSKIVEPYTLQAGADLSGKQYHIVRQSAALVTNMASLATDVTIAGVLQNKPQNNSSTPHIVSDDYVRYHASTEAIPLIPASVVINAASYRLGLFLLMTIPVATSVLWQAIPYIIAPLGMMTYAYNKRINEKLASATLSDELVIKPFSSVTFLIFIPESVFYGLFDLCVFNTETRSLITLPIDAAGNSIHIPGVYVI